jgi:hypothetical protein
MVSTPSTIGPSAFLFDRRYSLNCVGRHDKSPAKHVLPSRRPQMQLNDENERLRYPGVDLAVQHGRSHCSADPITLAFNGYTFKFLVKMT